MTFHDPSRESVHLGLRRLSGKVGSAQVEFELSRVGSSRVKRSSKYHGSGRVTLTRSDLRAVIRLVKSPGWFCGDKTAQTLPPARASIYRQGHPPRQFGEKKCPSVVAVEVPQRGGLSNAVSRHKAVKIARHDLSIALITWNE